MAFGTITNEVLFCQSRKVGQTVVEEDILHTRTRAKRRAPGVDYFEGTVEEWMMRQKGWKETHEVQVEALLSELRVPSRCSGARRTDRLARCSAAGEPLRCSFLAAHNEGFRLGQLGPDTEPIWCDQSHRFRCID